MGLPFDTPGEIYSGAMARAMVGKVERQLDRTDTIGTPLTGDGKAAAAGAGTVFVVSGFAATERGLQPILRSLARDGFDARGVAIPEGGLASARDGVAALDRAIAAAPAGPIHLAGHSKGGVVVQSWFAQASPAQQARVGSITLLSSTPTGQRLPLATQLASAWLAPISGPYSRSVAETSYGDPVMAQIRAARIAETPGVRAMSIVSERDGLIRLPEAHWKGGRDVVLRGADAPDHLHTLVSGAAYDALVGNVTGQSR